MSQGQYDLNMESGLHNLHEKTCLWICDKTQKLCMTSQSEKDGRAKNVAKCVKHRKD